MHLARFAYRTINSLLGTAGLQITRKQLDFECRITQSHTLDRFFSSIGDIASDWISIQKVFEPKIHLDFKRECEFFFERYLSSPYRDQFGGSRFNNLLWLYLICKSARPKYVIDSGTYTGASAWALSTATPDSTITSYDIDLSRLKQRMPNVRYVETDWMSDNPGDLSDSLIYFDDHVDQAKRLIEAFKRGIPFAIFDDDFPVSAFAPMAHGGFSLPKIEFVLDQGLREIDKLTWLEGGTQFTWNVPHDYLDQARATIDATERLPNISLITGIHQTPYRLVKIRRH